MNEIMKVLTIISTIFIPLTFIVGLYGMNFKFMPELEWHWGYPAVLVLMLGVTVFMLFYFRRKKWL
jgi:magnesium transporter